MLDRKRAPARFGVVAATAACALLLAAPATAKKREYQGPIGPSGAISFAVKGKKQRMRVVDLAWYRLPVECGKRNKRDSSTGTLTFSVPVKRHRFSAYAVYGKKKRPKAEAIIKGRIKGGRAHGKIIVRGSRLPVDDARSGNCDSGKHRWNAAA